MKWFLAVCVVAVAFVVFGAGAANAADLHNSGQVSDQTLSAMGLSGMERLSDAQGQQIRGKSFTFAMNFAWIKATKAHVGVIQIIKIGR